MILLRFGRSLNAVSFESALRAASPYTKQAGGWVAAARDDGILVDLERVEFAEFSSLAQLALFVEGALRHRVKVTCVLPSPAPRDAELGWIDRQKRQGSGDEAQRLVGRAVWSRRSALRFMANAGFLDVLNSAHVPESRDLLTVLRAASSRGVDDPLKAAPLSPPSERAEARAPTAIFPLQWYPGTVGVAVDTWETEIAAVLMGRQLLDPRDAQAVARVLIHELVENVQRHAAEPATSASCPPHALVGAIAVHPRSRPAQTNPAIRDYLLWAIREGLLNESGGSPPMARIIVGDSGVGIPRTLGVGSDHEVGEFAPDLGRPLRRSELLTFWAMNPLSTRDRSTARLTGGIRGLGRVSRLVRGYQGMLTVRCEDSLVGWVFPKRRRQPVASGQLRHSPGTLVDAWLLSVPAVRGRPLEGGDGAPHAAPEVEVVFPASGPVQSSLNIESLKQAHTAGDGSPIVLTVDQLPALGGAASFALDLAAASAIAGELDRPLAVAVLRGLEQEFSPALEAVDQAREEAETAILRELNIPADFYPVMVLSGSGSVSWFGGTPELRKVLYELLEADGRLPGSKVAELEASGERRDNLSETLLRETDWVKEDSGGGLTLRATPAHVDTAIIAAAENALTSAVNAGTLPGVERGIYMTPSLEMVSRRFLTENQEASDVGQGMLVYALARRVEGAFGQNRVQGATILRVDLAGRGMAEDLATALRAQRPRRRLAWETYPGRPAQLELTDGGGEVVCFVEVLVSGNTVRAALSEIIRTGSEPIGVACIVDGREEPDRAIEVLDRSIPVVAVAQCGLLTHGSPQAYLDPIWERPEAPSDAKGPGYPLRPEDFLQICAAEPEALLLGHLEGDSGRHFTTYLGMETALRSKTALRSRVVDAYYGEVQTWLQESPSEAVEIWFPGESDGAAGQLAAALATHIRNSDLTIRIARVRPIRRRAFGGTWRIHPPPTGCVAGVAVLVVDWGAITARTVHKMLQLASDSGASRVRAVILASEMPTEDELALRRLAALRSPTLSSAPMVQLSLNAGDRQERLVNVSVSFLTALPLAASLASECELCGLGARYSQHAKHAPTSLLRRHAAEMAERLVPQPVDAVAGVGSHDLHGGRPEPSDAVAVVLLRALLARALTSTRARAEVVQRLEDDVLRGPLATTVWLRLLSLEPGWLKKPPLRFVMARRTLTDMLLAFLRAGPLDGYSPKLKRQAVLILRAANKRAFLAALAEITMLSSAEGFDGTETALFGLYEYLQRPYHHTEQGLTRALQAISDSMSALQADRASAEVLATVGSLSRQAQAIRAGLEERLSPRAAWLALQANYASAMTEHHPAISSAQAVFAAFEGPMAEKRARSRNEKPGAEYWARKLSEWEQCADLVTQTVLPYLGPLRECLLGAFEEGAHGPRDVQRWEDLVSSQAGALELSRVDSVLAQLCDEPHGFTPEVRAAAERELEWWFRFVLNPGPGRGRRAEMLKLLTSCPSRLFDGVNRGFERAQERRLEFRFSSDITLSYLDVVVFCPWSLVRDAVEHLIENAAGMKHAEAPSSEGPRIFLTLRATETEVVLRMRNDQTRPSANPGHGLRKLRARLAPYGGRIEAGPCPEHAGWSYEVAVTLERWSQP